MAHHFSDPKYDTQAYENHRPKYPKVLYDTVLQFQAEGGSGSKLAIDLGCGPGTATRVLADHYEKVIGIDPSPSMIATAKSTLEATGGDPQRVSFRSGNAETLDFIENASVDLVTSATAAHWFTPQTWWAEMKRIVKPGGIVAFWSYSGLYLHPSLPGASELKRIGDEYRERMKEYGVKGNDDAKEMYRNFPIPGRGEVSMDGWSEVKRLDWDTDGIPSADGGKGAFAMERVLTLDGMRKALGTASTFHAWRQLHPEVKPGSEDDVVEQIVRKVKEIAGIEEGEQMKAGSALGGWMVRRSAD